MGSHPNITNSRFPRQGAYLGRRASVVFHYGKEIVRGVVVRDDADEPWETIIRLDDGRFVRSVECQWRPERSADEMRGSAAMPLSLDSILDSLLGDPDWDDCDKGDAYNALGDLRSQRDELRYRIEALEREIENVLSLLMRRSKYFDEADMVFRFACTFDRLNAIAARISKEAKS